MRMWKKICAVVTAGVICAMGLPWTVSAEEEVYTYGDLSYDFLEDGTIEIIGCDETATEVEIPAEINGVAVTFITWAAFSGNTNLTTINIPDSVTDIGSFAFTNCTSLTDITIPDSVTDIGAVAFRNCTSLTSVTIPNSVTQTGGGIFYGCTALQSVTLSDQLTALWNFEAGEGMPGFFEGCSALEEITIPEGVTTIGNSAFKNCTSLTNITIPNSVTSIGCDAFSETPWLTEKQEENPFVAVNDILIDGTTCSGDIIIPDTIKYIGDGAFSDCVDLTSVVIPDSVTGIGSSAFFGCAALSSVIISNSVTYICYGAFFDCTSLSSIVIPESVTGMGGSVFENTALLHNQTGVKYVDNWAVDCDVDVTDAVIKEGTRGIASYAFADTDLTAITIPDSVINIGCDAFYCTPLLNDQTGVKYADNWVVDCNYGITNAVIKEGTKGIAEEAFIYCPNLTSITIPASVTNFGWDVFYQDENLVSVYITDVAAWCNIDFTNIYGHPLYYAENLYVNGVLTTDIVVPDGVESINSGVFYRFTSLSSVMIPESVTNIDESAFQYCENLSDVYYAGTEDEWNAIAIEEGNAPLINATIHFESEVPEIVYSTGDIDNNNTINADDAYLCLLAYAKLSVGNDSGLTAAQITAADVNGDGKITPDDAYYILLYYAKKSVGQNPSWEELLS